MIDNKKPNTSGLHCEPELCPAFPSLNLLAMDNQLVSGDVPHHITFFIGNEQLSESRSLTSRFSPQAI